MAQHELSGVLSKYLDRHLVFPLLEFLQEKGIYKEEDIMRAKLALLKSTNLVDFAIDIHKVINNTEDVPADMMSRRHEVVSRLRKLQVHPAPPPLLQRAPHIVQLARYTYAMIYQPRRPAAC